jgi:putative DNA primase/helicase
MQKHEYLASKGFPDETVLVVEAEVVAKIAGKYLVPEGGKSAIIMPARIGPEIRSVQLIWESGAKKFLAHGETGGASHRIATGRDSWLCEGLATGLSLRAVLKSLRHSATILCCFSASNIEKIAAHAQGRVYIAADNDKPIEQFNWLGTGEFYARRSGISYFMPPTQGDDLNDMHQRDGVFAVQRLVCDFLKGARK